MFQVAITSTIQADTAVTKETHPPIKLLQNLMELWSLWKDYEFRIDWGKLQMITQVGKDVSISLLIQDESFFGILQRK